MHAPYDLSYYDIWTSGSGIAKDIVAVDGQKALQVKYEGTSSPNTNTRSGDPQPFDPINIPTPAPLLLLATGLLLAGSFRRRA
jgi:hypothetical protein